MVCAYCEYKQQDIQSPQNLLASLWPQLVKSKDNVGPNAKALYTHHKRLRTTPDIDEITRLVYSEMKEFSCVYILVDAIDECSAEVGHRAGFLKILQSLLDPGSIDGTRVQIMVTSRTKDSLLSGVTSVEIIAAHEDVRSFAIRRLQDQETYRSRTIFDYVCKDEAMRDKLATAIVGKAQGIFLAARLLLDSLRTRTSMKSVEQGIEKVPLNLNGILDTFYVGAWVRISQSDNEFDHMARKTICWLSNACRQLEEPELCHALAIGNSTSDVGEEDLVGIQDVLDSCLGLVTLDDESRIVRLVHYTAQEFFDRHNSQYFARANIQLTSMCLKYLMLDVFATGRCRFSVSLRFGRNPKGRVRKKNFLEHRTQRYPFLTYCSQYWGDHARGEPERECRDIIMRFLRSPEHLSSASQASSRCPNLALHLASFFGLEYTLISLLSNVELSHINEKDLKEYTALHWAIEMDRIKVAQMLLSANANINVGNNYGQTALLKAIVSRREAIVSAMLADPSVIIDHIALQCAVYSGLEIVVNRYICEHPTIEDKISRANRVLHRAALAGRVDIIRIALQQDATSISENEEGEFPLQIAIKYGRSSAVDCLIQNGASLNVHLSSGYTPLQLAAMSIGVFKERFDLIMNYQTTETRLAELEGGMVSGEKARVSNAPFLNHLKQWIVEEPGFELMERPEFWDALHDDVEHQHIIQQLLHHKGDLSVRTKNGETLLHLSICSFVRTQAFLDVASQHLEIDARDQMGRTALHYAAAAGNLAVMELLIDRGADITIEDNEGASILHFGVPYPECTRLAIARGARVNVFDRRARTPLHYAILWEWDDESVRPKVEHMLKDAGVKASAIDVYGKWAACYKDQDAWSKSQDRENLSWIRAMWELYPLKALRIRFYLGESQGFGQRHQRDFAEELRQLDLEKREFEVVSDSDEEDFEKA